MRIKHLGVVLIAAITLSACGGNAGLYEWGAYEAKLYDYSKKPDKREDYRSALFAAVEKGKKDNRIAPGLNAELGFLFLEDGDFKTAASYFETEQQLFPESAFFLNAVISRAQGFEPASADPAAEEVDTEEVDAEEADAEIEGAAS